MKFNQYHTAGDKAKTETQTHQYILFVIPSPVISRPTKFLVWLDPRGSNLKFSFSSISYLVSLVQGTFPLNVQGLNVLY